MSVLVYSIGSGVIIYLASSMGHSRLVRPVLGINDVVGILYYTGIVLALISGIFAGKIITGESLGGLWYAWLYILITALTILLSERILTTHIFP
jgi:hypothetical protein